MNKSLLLLTVFSAISLARTYTWPSPWDELEDIAYLQSGHRRRGFHDGITPCGSFPQGGGDPFRQASAEWLRSAFHDAVTHNKATGTGGLDASLLYETDRPENNGAIGFKDTFAFFNNFFSRRVSLADLIALGVSATVRECGGPVIPFRAGRVDATEAGEFGVPEPTTGIDATAAQFAKAGFTVEEMIALVACGHTLGGVHGNDFPDIVGNDSHEAFPGFDKTSSRYDNNVVTEFLAGNTTNPLAVGPEGTNSDQRVFVADKNVTMQSLANPATFQSTCASVFQRMVETVPATVNLSETIAPIDVKPTISRLYLKDQTAVHFEGYIRVRMTDRKTEAPVVQMPYVDSTGAHCDDCTIAAQPATFQGGMGFGFDDSFKFYDFSTDLQPGSISRFNIQFTADADETHTNNDLGYPVDKGIFHQFPNSCLIQKDDENGNWNLTTVAAVRNDRAGLPTWMEVGVKRFTDGIVSPKLDVQKVEMTKWKEAGSSGFTLYSANFALPIASWSTTYDLFNGEGDDQASVLNVRTTEAMGTCNDWVA
ncbi:hypothetical protein V5O48_002813 [Marasmius crinis-equi]|uniref:Peroxidase n=1 Tax=Marasmius crinis-equi TaxID=585013 RepID=A0ABR3FUL7_9AGAR